MPKPQPARAIFVSDQHLGFPFSRAAECLAFLKKWQAPKIYLVGDFLDGWRLKARWYWPPEFDALVEYLLGLIDEGTEVFYTPGNHDEFLRKPHPTFKGLTVADEFIHETAEGHRLLVTHGDLFDSIEKKLHRLSRFGSAVYDTLTRINLFTNRIQSRLGLGEWNYCFLAKRISKRIVGAAGGFEKSLTEHATSQNCRGVICGHIHFPLMKVNSTGFVYINTGDWVEHRSGVVELMDGSLQLIDRARVRSNIDAGLHKV